MKNLIATMMFTVVFIFGASNANAGLIMSDIATTEPQPCQEKSDESKTDWGIIVTDLAGIIVTDLLNGIIVTDVATPPTDCGIIVTD